MFRIHLLVLCAAALAGSLDLADAADDGGSVRVKLVVERHVDGAVASARELDLVTTVGGPPFELRQGREMPVGEDYRNVGLNVSCRVAEGASPNTYIVRFSVEQSSLAEGSGPARFDTFHVTSAVTLDTGSTTEVRTTSERGEGQRFLLRISLEE